MVQTKTLAVIGVVLLVGLAGCGGTDTEAPANETNGGLDDTTTEALEDTTEETTEEETTTTEETTTEETTTEETTTTEMNGTTTTEMNGTTTTTADNGTTTTASAVSFIFAN